MGAPRSWAGTLAAVALLVTLRHSASCTVKSGDGEWAYNLASLATQSSWNVADSNGFTYSLAFCAPIACGSNNDTMAVQAPTSARSNCIKAFGASGRAAVATLPNAEEEDGLQLTFGGGPRCGGLAAGASSVVYSIRCGSAGTGGEPYSLLAVGAATDDCTLHIDMTGPAGCPAELPDEEHDLSGGWVFVIILFSATVGYCGLGIAFKACYRRATGLEILPHVDFWRATASNIRLGAAVTWARLTCAPDSVDDSVYAGLDDDLGLGGGEYHAAPETSGGGLQPGAIA